MGFFSVHDSGYSSNIEKNRLFYGEIFLNVQFSVFGRVTPYTGDKDIGIVKIYQLNEDEKEVVNM